jgi:hypothetical protein
VRSPDSISAVRPPLSTELLRRRDMPRGDVLEPFRIPFRFLFGILNSTIT